MPCLQRGQVPPGVSSTTMLLQTVQVPSALSTTVLQVVQKDSERKCVTNFKASGEGSGVRSARGASLRHAGNRLAKRKNCAHLPLSHRYVAISAMNTKYNIHLLLSIILYDDLLRATTKL